MKLFATTICLLMLSLTLNAGTEKPIILKVNPSFGICAPGKNIPIYVDIWIAPNDKNRGIIIAIESADFYTSTQINLEGADSPKHIRLQQPFFIGEGEYIVSAKVFDSTGATLASDSQNVRIS
jgi:hypothetical protein